MDLHQTWHVYSPWRTDKLIQCSSSSGQRCKFRQTETYQRHLHSIIITACPILSCQRQDVGVKCQRFIFYCEKNLPYAYTMYYYNSYRYSPLWSKIPSQGSSNPNCTSSASWQKWRSCPCHSQERRRSLATSHTYLPRDWLASNPMSSTTKRLEKTISYCYLYEVLSICNYGNKVHLKKLKQLRPN